MPRWVRVALPVPVDRVFTYRVPEGTPAERGRRVVVRFSGRSLAGVVMGEVPEPGRRVFPLTRVLEEVIPEGPLRLAEWIATYYLAPIGEAVQLATPPRSATRVRRWVRLLPRPETSGPMELFPDPRARVRGAVQQKVLGALNERGGAVAWGALERQVPGSNLAATVSSLEKAGLVVVDAREDEPREATVRALRLVEGAEPSGRLGPRGQELVSLLRERGESIPTPELRREHGFSDSTLKSVVRRGWAELETLRPGGLPSVPSLPTRPIPSAPSDAQKTAIDAITARMDELAESAPSVGREFLLYGVTGSGKTLVYLEAARAARARGRGVLVLVPEIALSTQMYSVLSRGLDEPVAVLHSGMPDKDRRRSWLALRRGECHVALGARSAVFAPVERLGLIVVDEEHEGAYKAQAPVPYHTRTAARFRAAADDALLVLGSATPALETYQATRTGSVTELRLPERIDARPLPRVEIVDMLAELRRGNREAFSVSMRDHIRRRLEVGEQVILLLNRRGYAPSIQCGECGHVPECNDCAVLLTYHRTDDRLRCHYCGHERSVPRECGACGASRARFRGRGTQRVEEELASRYPSAKVVRLDQDATRRSGAHFEILDAFARGEAQILLGTQMVAKGLDIPNVTLVGVVNADIGLSIPDFRAGERIFQLLTQVAGRAGRGDRPGQVVVQTSYPGHYAVRHAQAHDYGGFFAEETAQREPLGYPPYSHLVSITVRSQDSEAAEGAGQKIAEALREAGGSCSVLGPAPSPVARIRGEHRWLVLVKAPDARRGRSLLRAHLGLALPPSVFVSVDVDPERMV